MILTLTPNPALDVTYEVGQVRVHGEHRVRTVRSAPGGKGVNVARVLTQLDQESLFAGLLGGTTGEQLAELLAHEANEANEADETDEADDATASRRQRQAWTGIARATRRTVTVVDPDGATAFNEPGPRVTTQELTALRSDLDTLLTGPTRRVAAVTISGSLPPGMTGADLAQLVRACRARDRPVLVDTSGAALREAARAGATVLAPNAAEALEATGEATPIRAAAALTELGAGIVVCSLGAEGMLALDRRRGESRAWRAVPAQALTGNPTGAGDAVAASLATTLLTGTDEPPEALRRAVAVGASAVTCPVAGRIDPQLASRLEATVEIEEIPCP